MIVVIADDFTGAAELAGIAWRFGLNAEVQTKFCMNRSPDVLIVDTDTRSENSQNAEEILIRLARELAPVQFDWLYKKTDSVLRGHVILELEILMRELEFAGALLVPANPSAKRVVKNGIYSIDGVLLCDTDFANDPEYPRVNSDVLSLLGENQDQHIKVLEAGERVKPVGIQIGECQSVNDLDSWASQLTMSMIPAGASDFFNQILKSKNYHAEQTQTRSTFRHQYPMLIMVGSVSEQSKQHLNQYRKLGIPICNPPQEINELHLSAQTLTMNWAEQIITYFKSNSIVVVSTHNPIGKGDTGLSKLMTSVLSSLTELIYDKIKVMEIVIEGGATASSIVRRLGWNHLIPIYELGKGIVVLQTVERSESQLIVKPGSYDWPEDFFDRIVIY